jgi:hypothetical protein
MEDSTKRIIVENKKGHKFPYYLSRTEIYERRSEGMKNGEEDSESIEHACFFNS